MRLFHGTTPLLVPNIARYGLRPQTDSFVHLASTPGLAWAYGAWAAGLTMAAGYQRPPIDAAAMLHPSEVAATVTRVLKERGPAYSAVAVIDTFRGLEKDPQTACPNLPWEVASRVAPCYRTRLTVEPSEIVEWQLYHVPELDDEAVLAAMTGDAQQLADEFPRGDAILEDLSAEPIGSAIPNGRRLMAAIIDQAGPVAQLPAHGTAHWASVAARALALHPDADLTVALLFALLHDACRNEDGPDPDHGTRAAQLAGRLNGDVFTLDAGRLAVLQSVCELHTDGDPSDDPTVGTCWDADRLDVTRFGQRVRLGMLSTDQGRAFAEVPAPTDARGFEAIFDDYRARS